MSTSPNLNPQVAASLALWHEMVAQQDLGRLPSILRDDAVFRSPMAFKPYVSAAAVNLILTTVVQVFKDAWEFCTDVPVWIFAQVLGVADSAMSAQNLYEW